LIVPQGKRGEKERRREGEKGRRGEGEKERRGEREKGRGGREARKTLTEQGWKECHSGKKQERPLKGHASSMLPPCLHAKIGQLLTSSLQGP
jgi:hypothetical protein